MAGGGDTASVAGRGARQRRTLGEQQPVAAGERELDQGSVFVAP